MTSVFSANTKVTFPETMEELRVVMPTNELGVCLGFLGDMELLFVRAIDKVNKRKTRQRRVVLIDRRGYLSLVDASKPGAVPRVTRTLPLSEIEKVRRTQTGRTAKGVEEVLLYTFTKPDILLAFCFDSRNDPSEWSTMEYFIHVLRVVRMDMCDDSLSLASPTSELGSPAFSGLSCASGSPGIDESFADPAEDLFKSANYEKPKGWKSPQRLLSERQKSKGSRQHSMASARSSRQMSGPPNLTSLTLSSVPSRSRSESPHSNSRQASVYPIRPPSATIPDGAASGMVGTGDKTRLHQASVLTSEPSQYGDLRVEPLSSQYGDVQRPPSADPVPILLGQGSSRKRQSTREVGKDASGSESRQVMIEGGQGVRRSTNGRASQQTNITQQADTLGREEMEEKDRFADSDILLQRAREWDRIIEVENAALGHRLQELQQLVTGAVAAADAEEALADGLQAQLADERERLAYLEQERRRLLDVASSPLPDNPSRMREPTRSPNSWFAGRSRSPCGTRRGASLSPEPTTWSDIGPDPRSEQPPPYERRPGRAPDGYASDGSDDGLLAQVLLQPQPRPKPEPPKGPDAPPHIRSVLSPLRRAPSPDVRRAASPDPAPWPHNRW